MASSLLGDTAINTAGADWLLKMIKDAGTTEEMINRCNVSLYKTAMHVLENGTKSKGTGRYTAIAIDKHKIPRYDKNANMVHAQVATQCVPETEIPSCVLCLYF